MGGPRILLVAFPSLMLALQSTYAFAQSPEDFYKGRQISLLIGGGAGGGYDVYYRAFARHVGKHIPGHPGIIPKNVPAASGLVAAATIYNTATRTASRSAPSPTMSRWTRCSAIRLRATTRA